MTEVFRFSFQRRRPETSRGWPKKIYIHVLPSRCVHKILQLASRAQDSRSTKLWFRWLLSYLPNHHTVYAWSSYSPAYPINWNWQATRKMACTIHRTWNSSGSFCSTKIDLLFSIVELPYLESLSSHKSQYKLDTEKVTAPYWHLLCARVGFQAVLCKDSTVFQLKSANGIAWSWPRWSPSTLYLWTVSAASHVAPCSSYPFYWTRYCLFSSFPASQRLKIHLISYPFWLTTPKGSALVVATSEVLNCDGIHLDNFESCSLMEGWTVLWSGRSAV